MNRFSDKTIKWFYPYLTQLFLFHDVFLGCRDHKLQNFPGIYIRNFVVFLLNINDIPQALSNSHTKCIQMIQVSFINISTLQISKEFQIKNLSMGNVYNRYSDNKLSISLLKVKLNAVSSVEKKI